LLETGKPRKRQTLRFEIVDLLFDIDNPPTVHRLFLCHETRKLLGRAKSFGSNQTRPQNRRRKDNAGPVSLRQTGTLLPLAVAAKHAGVASFSML